MYFISKNNKKEGPLTFDEVRNLKLTDDVLIWKEGMADWTQITNLPEFQEFIIKTPPPLPDEKRDKEKKEFKTKRDIYARKIFLRNSLIGLILAIILDLIMTQYSLTGGTDGYHIFVTHEERENPSIIFLGLFPYFLLIGEILLLLTSTIQVIIFQPQSNTIPIVDPVLVKYKTDKGQIEVSQKLPYLAPDIGNEVFQNGKLISNETYKMGFMWYIYVENGRIVKVFQW
jgi:hypothetical protein